MYDVKIPQRKPWSDNQFIPKVVAAYTDFAEIIVNSPNATIKKDFHSARMLAKGRGVELDPRKRVESVKAASQLVKDALYNEDGSTSHHVRSVYESVLSNLSSDEMAYGPTIFLPTIVREKNAGEPEVPGQISKNALATVYTIELSKALQKLAEENGDRITFSTREDRRMLRLDSDIRLPRREADIYQRFSRQNIYTAKQFQKGEYALITDDHVETAASIKSQIDALENNNVKVVGIATFGALSESLDLRPPIDAPYIAQILWFNKRITKTSKPIADLKIELDEGLKLCGISLDSLTKRELLALAGILLDQTSEGAISFFEDLKLKFNVDPNAQEGDRNGLQGILENPAVSVTDFFREMKINQIMEAIMSRQPNPSERKSKNLVNEEDDSPLVFISAGGPAVGKSRIVGRLEEKKFFPEKTMFVSASMFEDCFTDQDFTRHFHPELLPEYFPLYKEAVARLGNWAFNNGFSFVWEDHFQDPEWTKSIVTGAKKLGYNSYATGLFIDEKTHRSHREDHGQIDESTPTSLQMMRLFAQNWEQLMNSGLFDYAQLFHRIKPANAPDWKVGTEERVIFAAEYYLQEHTDEPVRKIHPAKELTIKQGTQTQRVTVDAFKIFEGWQNILINPESMPGDWDGIIEGTEKSFGHFTGKTIDLRKTNKESQFTAARSSNFIQPRI